MEYRGGVLQSDKQFSKEIGALEEIISDAAGEKLYNYLSKLCRDIDTTLRVLEEVTPWTNKAELYIG